MVERNSEERWRKKETNGEIGPTVGTQSVSVSSGLRNWAATVVKTIRLHPQMKF